MWWRLLAAHQMWSFLPPGHTANQIAQIPDAWEGHMPESKWMEGEWKRCATPASGP